MCTQINNQTFDEERAFYGIRDAEITNCRFDGPADGESAFKESGDLTVNDSVFNLRYPFWHTDNAEISGSEFTNLCRAAMWYDSCLSIENSRLYGVKAIRESENVYLESCDVVSPEFMWKCRNIQLQDCSVESEYPFFECRGIKAEGMELNAKYSFQYAENGKLKNCRLKTKDAFWHSKNITVEDCVIDGEYIGWYSENLTLIRCKITGTQPFCYCKNLVLSDCTLEKADLAFEKSEVYAVLRGTVESVKNPLCGRITADKIGQTILDPQVCNPLSTVIKLR